MDVPDCELRDENSICCCCCAFYFAALLLGTHAHIFNPFFCLRSRPDHVIVANRVDLFHLVNCVGNIAKFATKKKKLRNQVRNFKSTQPRTYSLAKNTYFKTFV